MPLAVTRDRLLRATVVIAALGVPMPARAEPVCAQAPSERAREVHFDSSLAFRGAGSARMSDGSFLLVWTGVDCIGWFRIRGDVSVDTTWRRLVVPRDGRFVAHEETARGHHRDYTLASNGVATLSVDDHETTIDSSAADWVDAMVREFVRRSGSGAARRATQIAQQQGPSALIEEAAHIPHVAIRAQYLIAGFPSVSNSGRLEFIRTGSETLDDPFARSSFLRAVPASWRSEIDILQAIYDEATRIEPDDLVEQLLRTIPPPSPTPAALKAPLGRLIATLQNSERRAVLRALYLADRT